MASGFPSVHQRKLGPAPIASFEDLSDEHENAGDATTVSRMPGIVEVATPATPGSSLKTPSTPRIDISRASSSSQQEDSNSRESTPEKELLAGMAPPEGSQLQLGYKEDANDLRSSTEELDLQDSMHPQDLKREAKRARRRAKDLRDGTQSEHGISIKIDGSGERERKDSNCSEIILLNISGRTSRLSSVGSQGSGVSGGALSAISATSSRSPSPHKCLLETSFCGSVSTLANTLIEPSKPETDDLARILLLREEDSTRAMIPESVRVPVVGGNLKPDPLDMPRRSRGREERKEIFKREVEITKRVLKKVNIEVPVIKLPKGPNDPSLQKPDTLDLNDKRKRSPSSSSRSGGVSGTALETPRLQRHQKIRDLEGSRTPSPSSVSRKSSFASLFKGRADAGSMASHDSPSGASSRRTSLASRLKDTAESLRSRSKSRERPGSGGGDRSPGKRPDSARSRGGSGAGGVFSSTLSLFRKRERKKSGGDGTRTPDTLDGSHQNLDSIGKVEFTFNQQQQQQQHATPSKPSGGGGGSGGGKKEDVIFISLYGENDEFRYKDEREYKDEEEPKEVGLPADFLVPKPPGPEDVDDDSPTRQLQQEYLDDDYNDASSPQQTSAKIVCTDATIEHHRRSKSDRRSRISSSSGDSTRISERDSMISKSDSRNSRIEPEDRAPSAGTEEHRVSSGSIREGRPQPPAIPKPRRKSRSQPVKPTEPPPAPPPFRADQLTNGTKALMAVPQEPLAKALSDHSDLDKNSSGSEKEAEIDFVKGGKGSAVVEDVPDERKGLCGEESFEEDLPYVPTTLPLEKSVAVPILPVKQRLQEVRSTKPIERPRSTTPINPTLLDEFVQHEERQPRRGSEKMRISLPREDSFRRHHHHQQPNSSFTEFAGRVSRGLSLTKSPSPPPPLPPRAPTTVLTTVPSRSAPPTTTTRPVGWINFEEIPEKRKAPKRIQTVPRLEGEHHKHGHHGGAHGTPGGQYSYVQPEECRCECHEESRRSLQRDTSTFAPRQPSPRPGAVAPDSGTRADRNASCNGSSGCPQQAASAPNADRASVVSDDSSTEYNLSAEYTTTSGARGATSGSRPFAMDLDVSSNRSSIISQEETEDEH